MAAILYHWRVNFKISIFRSDCGLKFGAFIYILINHGSSSKSYARQELALRFV